MCPGKQSGRKILSILMACMLFIGGALLTFPAAAGAEIAMVEFRAEGAPGQQWTFEKRPFFTIQNKRSGQFLTVAWSDTTPVITTADFTGESSQLWRLAPEQTGLSLNQINIINADGILLGYDEAAQSVSPYNQPLHGTACFLLSGACTTAPANGSEQSVNLMDWYRIGGQPLSLSLDDDGNVAFAPGNAADSRQVWIFDQPVYTIRNTETGRYLDFDGSVLTTRAATGDDNQRWYFRNQESYHSGNLINVRHQAPVGADNPEASDFTKTALAADMTLSPDNGYTMLQLNGQPNGKPAPADGSVQTLHLVNWYKLAGGVPAVLTDVDDDLSAPEEPDDTGVVWRKKDAAATGQAWHFVETGMYRLKNKATGEYLTWDGAALKTAARDAADNNQLWTFTPNGAGLPGLLNMVNYSGRLVGGREEPNATALNTDLIPANGGALLLLSGQYEPAPESGAERTVDIAWYKIGTATASLSVSGQNALLEAQDGGDRQIWVFEKEGAYYRVQNGDTGKYLAIDGDPYALSSVSGYAADTRPVIGPLLWTVADAGNAYAQSVNLIHTQTGRLIGTAETSPPVLSLDALPTSGGGSLLLDGQYTTAPRGDRLYTIETLSWYSFGGTPGALTDTTPVRIVSAYQPGGSAAGSASHPSTVWHMEAADGGYLLFDALTHRYLTARGGTVIGADRSGMADQLWQPGTAGGFTTFRNNQTGTYLALSGTSDAVALTAAADGNAQWVVTGEGLLQNAGSGGSAATRYLQMFLRDTEAEGTLMLETKGHQRSQRYALTPVALGGTTYYRIQSTWSELVLTAADGKRVEERPLTTGSEDAQLWEFRETASGPYVALNIVNKGNGLGMSLIDPYNVSGGPGSTIQLVDPLYFSGGQALWYLNGGHTVDSAPYVAITPLYPNGLALASRGAKALPPVDTRTIYVSAAGNDAHSGFSEAQAIKTIGRLNELIASMPLTAGNTIKLRRGDTFVGTIRLTGNRGREDAPITITGYGAAAANPKLVAPPILTKTQVEAELAAGRPVSYNTAAGVIKNGIITSALLVENCENVAVDGLDGYSDNNAEDFYQYISDPAGLFHFNDTIGLAVKNCDLSGVIQRRVKDYIADVTGENRNLGPYPGGWTASYAPYRGNDYHGVLVNNSRGHTNADMTNIVVENVTATKLTAGLCMKNSSGFTVRNFRVFDSPCWGFDVSDSSNGQVLDCETSNTGYGLNPNGNAAYMVSSSQQVVFDGIRAYNSQRGPQPYDGVAFDFEGGINQRDVTLRNAVIDGSDGPGIMVFSNTDGNRDFVIDNVHIQNYLRSGNAGEGALYFIQDFGNGTVSNTTVVASRVNGVMMPYYGYLKPDRLGGGGLFYPANIPDVPMYNCSFLR